MTKAKSNSRTVNAPEEISSQTFVSFFQKHQDILGYIGIGIAIIAVVVVLFVMNNRSKDRQASLLLQRAMTTYNNTFNTPPSGKTEDEKTSVDPTASINGFQEIIDNFPNSGAGIIAQYMLGNCYLNSGDNSKAGEIFKKFIDAHPSHIFCPNAELGRATALYGNGDVKASLDLLKNIETKYPDFAIMDVVKFEIAKRYENEGNWSKARSYYQSLMEKYPDSGWKYMAQRRITELDKSHPIETDDVKKSEG